MEREIGVVPGHDTPSVQILAHSETHEDPTFPISVLLRRKMYIIKLQNLLKIKWWNITDFKASSFKTYKQISLTLATR
jgi:hypothetical protein